MLLSEQNLVLEHLAVCVAERVGSDQGRCKYNWYPDVMLEALGL
jgi:hypothetical protein